jgi:Type I phosphodiesterase / nucleotide pyrophosphatase
VYESLPCRSLVVLPRGIERSSFTRLATRGARVVGCDGLDEGCRVAVDALRGGEAGYAFVYWSEIDTVGHEYGPSSAEFDRAAKAALDAAWSVFAPPGGRCGCAARRRASSGFADSTAVSHPPRPKPIWQSSEAS